MLSQADDFLAESEALAALLERMSAEDWDRPTLFKGWTPNDVVVHLHFWNRAADLSARDEEAFQALASDIIKQLPHRGMRGMENAAIAERGPALLQVWRAFYQEMAARWRGFDPKKRVKWLGPDMSVRSSISARQMETWAHGHEVFDLMGEIREEKDRIANIVRIGVNTYGWSFQTNGKTPPEPMPYLALTAPSGAVWTFGEESAPSRIEGEAVGFAQVVTQTRNIADTRLKLTGEAAESWMAIAQCFAGPPETPPAPGARHRAARG